MNPRLAILLLALLVSQTLPLFSETIDVTDKDGRSISARLVKCDGKSLDIVRASDSRPFTVPVSNLDETTRTAVDLWMNSDSHLSETFVVTIDTGKTRRTTGTEDFDDKRVNLEPILTVKNADTKQESKPLEITLLFLGRPVESTTDMFVFRIQTFPLPKIQPLNTREFQVKAISSPYDNRGYAQFGSRYLGYVWVIHNPEDSRIVASASVPTNLAGKHGETFLKLKEGETYDRELRKIEAARR